MSTTKELTLGFTVKSSLRNKEFLLVNKKKRFSVTVESINRRNQVGAEPACGTERCKTK